MLRLPTSVAFCLYALFIAITVQACHPSRSGGQPPENTLKSSSQTTASIFKATDKPIVISNVTIVDGTGNKPLRHQTVIIENGKILTIGEASKITPPADCVIIDGTGKTIIPGIVGMHNHMHMPGIPYLGRWGALMYLAAGVTTIQTCGSASPDKELALADSIENNLAIGPEIIASAPYFTGPGGNPNMIIPRDEVHIRDTIAYWADNGVRWFKVYRHTNPEHFEYIAHYVHKNGGKLTGHLCSITHHEAIEWGIDGIEHGLNSAMDFSDTKSFGQCNGSREFIDELDVSGEEAGTLLREMISNDVFLTSTLAIYEGSIPSRVKADSIELGLMPERMLAAYSARLQSFSENVDKSTEQSRIREQRFRRIYSYEKRFYEMGGKLIAGVDAGRHVLPGFGDQRNFQILVDDAGYLPEEAIQIMTANGASVLENDSIGRIAEGMQADLVLLDGNLTESSEVIRHVELVFKRGIAYNPRLLLRKALPYIPD